MPGMTGADLLAALRSHARTQTAPAILLSSADLVARADEFRSIGFSGVLTKPARIESVMDNLCTAMGLNAPRPVERQADLPAGINGLAGLKVMVVDDNKTNRTLVRMMLKNHDVDLQEHVNGRDAVDAFDAMRPDVVLMDLSMPIMGGVEATHHIRDIERGRGSAPAVVLGFTANAMTEAQKAFLTAGASGFLHKPLKKRDLLEALQDAAMTRAQPNPPRKSA